MGGMKGCGATWPLEPPLGGVAVTRAGLVIGGGVGGTGGGSRPRRGMLLRARMLGEEALGCRDVNGTSDDACPDDELFVSLLCCGGDRTGGGSTKVACRELGGLGGL